MDITKKAEEYAANKASDCLTKMIAQAYEDGYRDGYNESRETLITNIAGDAGEFVDLGLPSGTLWASKNLEQESNTEFLPYDKAIRFSIPTDEQWEELSNNCEWVYHYYSDDINIMKVRCVGPNGNEIVFFDEGMYKGTERTNLGKIYFWLSVEQTEKTYYNAVEMVRADKSWSPTAARIHTFKGFKLPVRLVKNKA